MSVPIDQYVKTVFLNDFTGLPQPESCPQIMSYTDFPIKNFEVIQFRKPITNIRPIHIPINSQNRRNLLQFVQNGQPHKITRMNNIVYALKSLHNPLIKPGCPMRLLADQTETPPR